MDKKVLFEALNTELAKEKQNEKSLQKYHRRYWSLTTPFFV